MDDEIQGFAFPFRIDPRTGRVAQASGLEKLRQNVRVVLGTRLGERPMLPEYGTRLPGLVQEPNDDVVGDILQRQAQQAVLRWEPRIVVTGATLRQSEGVAELYLQYVQTTLPAADQMTVPLG